MKLFDRKNRKTWSVECKLAILSAFLGLALVGVSFPSFAASETLQAKTGGALYRILEKYAEAPSGAQAYAQIQGVEVKGQKIVVVIEGIGDLTPFIKRYGGTVQAKYQALWQVELPLESIPHIAAFRPVHYLRLPLRASTTGLFVPSSPGDPPITEGLRLIGADKYHARGYEGQGVKIAIIDLGFAGLQESIQAGALPPDVLDRAHDFTPVGDVELGEAHGTAVAEIIHAIAPEAELYLYKVSTETELGQAMQMAMDSGVRIINHSVAWFNDGFYQGDGTIARIIKTAWRSGILWINAAGNFAQHHYEGEFHDSDGDGYHDEVIELDLSSLPTLNAVAAYLTWDGWPRTSENFDLVLERGGQPVAISDNPQTKADPNEPDERIVFRVMDTTDQGVYHLRVKWAGTGSPPQGRRLEIFISAPQVVTTRPVVLESSIPAPANADWVVAVGAIPADVWELGLLEEFSSRGPTNDGRDKPDLVAPDKVRCFTYSQENMTFVGTSASAPHVAGMAALLLSEKPTSSVLDLYQELIGRAWPVPGGARTEFGAGRASLVKPKLANLTITSAKPAPPQIEPGQEVKVQVRVENQGDAESEGFWVALWRAGERAPGSEIDSYRVRPLPPGEMCELTLVWKLPDDFSLSELELVVTADPYGDVMESNEEDNEKAVVIQVELPKPTLKVAPLELDFGELPVDEVPSPLTIQVSNIGVGTLRWSADSNVTWLELEPKEGELDSGQSVTVTARVTTSDLSVGRHEAVVTFAAEDAEGSPQELLVSVLIYEPANLEVSPQSISFLVREKEGPPDSRTITIKNPGGRPLSWTARTGADWIKISTTEGQLGSGESEPLEVSVKTTGLAFGEHEATLLITAPEVGQVEVRVKLTYTPAFRVVSVTFPHEIPADGTQVSGTVEFMGAHHVVRAIFEVVKAVSFSEFEFNPYTDCSSYTFDLGTGKGSFGFSLYSNLPQVVELKLTLVDEEGNRTNPYHFTFECVAPGD